MNRLQQPKHKNNRLLPNNGPTEKLASSINSYYERLRRSPEAKTEHLDLDDLLSSFSLADLQNAIKRLIPQYVVLLEKYSLAKHALKLCSHGTRLKQLNDLIPFWIRVCVEAGAYDDCISFSEFDTKRNPLTANILPAQQLAILFSRAKAFRNTGRFKEAQHCYREAITTAESIEASADVSFGLLLIGKLYGNYLGQRSLFSSFVEEAKGRLNSQLKQHKRQNKEYRRLVQGIAICHDALGQAYRYSDNDWHKVEGHFLDAIRLNEKIGRTNGVSRATCHLTHFRFKRASDPDEQRYWLAEFNRGMNMLMDESPDERGLGIRFVQYASMIRSLESNKAAQEYLVIGKRFARRYSDHKTLTRAAVVEAELLRVENPERAINVLKEGRLIAQSYNLPIQESEINLLLANLAKDFIDSDTQLTDLFNRNRDIHIRLISEVKGSLYQLHATENTEPEFQRLSSETRQAFGEKLLLDFDHTVKQLDLNIQALTTTLRLNERKRQASVVYEICNSVARLLLHEYKAIILADTTFTPLHNCAKALEAIARKIESMTASLKCDGDERDQLEIVVTSLQTQMEIVCALGEELERIKVLLSEKLQRPQVLEEKVSLADACAKAIEELRQQKLIVRDNVSLKCACDIRVLFNNDIMVTVIQNLIRNSLEEIMSHEFAEADRVVVILETEQIGDSAVRNPAKAATLSVLMLVNDPKAIQRIGASIQRGLDGYPSTKPYGTGFGLDFAKLVFKDLMGASLQVIENKDSVGTKVLFRTGNNSVQVIPTHVEA